MAKTVDDGAQLYRQQQNPDRANPADDLRATSGTVAWGRVLHRAQRGDQAARDEVQRRARAGEKTAGAVIEGAGTNGPRFEAGTEPGSVTPDDFAPPAA